MKPKTKDRKIELQRRHINGWINSWGCWGKRKKCKVPSQLEMLMCCCYLLKCCCYCCCYCCYNSHRFTIGVHYATVPVHANAVLLSLLFLLRFYTMGVRRHFYRVGQNFPGGYSGEFLIKTRNNYLKPKQCIWGLYLSWIITIFIIFKEKNDNFIKI